MSTYGPISFKVRATSGCNHSDWSEVSSAYYGAPQTTWTGAVDGDWSNVYGNTLDIDIFSFDLRIVPIGLSSTSAQTVKIRFIDTESFYDVDVFLVNKLTGEEVNLKEVATYEYTMQSARDEGNLFIEFRTTENIATSAGNATVGPIEVYADHNEIRVVSSVEDIETVMIMDDLGRIVTKQTINAPTAQVVMSSQPLVYTVQVVTASQTVTRRVMIR